MFGVDVHIAGVHDDRLIRDEGVVRLHDAVAAEILQRQLQLLLHADLGVLRIADLDVHAQPVRAENVVVKADAVVVGLALGHVDPVLLEVRLLLEAEVEDEHLVVAQLVRERGVLLPPGMAQEQIQRHGVDERFVFHGLTRVEQRGFFLQIDAFDRAAEAHAALIKLGIEQIHKGARAVSRIEKARVVGGVLAALHVVDDLGDVRVGEEAAHRVLVERAQVAGVELFVVRAQELLHDGAAELAVEHVLKALVVVLLLAVEEIVQAVDELLLRQLVNVRLEGVVDQLPFIEDARALVLHDDVLFRRVFQKQVAVLLGLEVEEVPRVVPDEAGLADRAAVAADLVFLFDDEIIAAQRVGRRETGDARADDERFNLHRALPPLLCQTSPRHSARRIPRSPSDPALP